jgi:hypothetical protein
MRNASGRVALAFILIAAAAMPATAQSGIELNHVWVMVSPNAPERAALTRAGFLISRDVNRHDGQGTASITVEFENAFLELIWLDSTVSVAPGMERGAEKFRQRMLWRSSGWCPIGVGLRRTTSSNDALPFPTWSWTAEWMPKGSKMEMLTPRDDHPQPGAVHRPRGVDKPCGTSGAIVALPPSYWRTPDDRAPPDIAQDISADRPAHVPAGATCSQPQGRRSVGVGVDIR